MMMNAIWLAGLALANFWLAGNLGSQGEVSNTEKGLLGGAAVGSGAGALIGRGNPAAMSAGVLGAATGGQFGPADTRYPVTPATPSQDQSCSVIGPALKPGEVRMCDQPPDAQTVLRA